MIIGRHARSLAGMVAIAALAAGLVAMSGCRQAEADAPKAEVRTVEAYGVTLDPAASPQQVAYVLLRSIADDYAAVRAKDPAAQRKAQETTMSVAAPRRIEERLLATANQISPKAKKENLGPDRDKKLFKTVHYWAPIVGHYVASFADADLQTVVRDSWVAVGADGRTAHVYYPVAHDPGESDPEKAQTATIDIELSREPAGDAQAGGAEYWRVSRVQFLGRQFRAPPAAQVVQAYGKTLDDSAGPAEVASAMLRTLADMAAAEQAGAKDQRVSAMCRAFSLSHPAQVLAQSGATPSPAGDETEDAITRTLAQAVIRWAELVQPFAATTGSTGFDAGRMQESAGPDGNTARVVHSPEQRPDAPEELTVELARKTDGGKSFWRVVNVAR